MTPEVPTNEPGTQGDSMVTSESRYFAEGHPHIMPVKPVLDPSKSKIYERTASNPQRATTMIAQPHPHDKVAAIIYSPAELAAMGFEGLTVPHSLASFENGTAKLVPEQRDTRRITLETTERLGLALDPKDKQSQREKEFEGAKARLERQMDTFANELKTAYTKALAEKFPEPTVDQKTVDTAKTALTDTLDSKLARDIKPGDLQEFLLTIMQRGRQNSINTFNEEGNFAWEDMLHLAISHSKERYFYCTTDVTEPLLRAGIAPRIIQLDDNPKHTVTISISPDCDLHNSPGRSNIVIKALHESGESFYDRYSKRNPHRSRSERMPR